MDSKACAELIAKRRSLRPSTMSQAPVPRMMINSILEAANWAPSHRLTEPWRFVVMQGEARRRLSEVFEKALLESKPDADDYTRKKTAAKPMRSPVLIAVICQPSDLPKVKQSEEEWAVACAVQNMALQATAHGLSIFWSTGTPVMHPMISEFFGCRGKALVMGCLHLGFIGEEGWPEGRRGAWENKVRWVSESQFEVPAWQPTPRSS